MTHQLLAGPLGVPGSVLPSQGEVFREQGALTDHHAKPSLHNDVAEAKLMAAVKEMVLCGILSNLPQHPLPQHPHLLTCWKGERMLQAKGSV